MSLRLSHDEYTPQDYDRIRNLDGFSEELLDTHVGLYEGYVEHTNKAQGLLRSGELGGYERDEVRRRMVWEFNGMRLHEIYFDALTPGGAELDNEGRFAEAVRKDFGSFDDWLDDFRATGSMRGIGWAALSYDDQQGRFFNHWINEHDAGALAGTKTVLLMDVFEHAFIRDFGTDKDAYMDAFFANLDWDVVAKRLD